MQHQGDDTENRNKARLCFSYFHPEIFMQCLLHHAHLPFDFFYRSRSFILYHRRYFSVFDLDHSVRHRSKGRVMSNNDYCHASFPTHILQKLQNCLSGLIIKRSCSSSQRRSFGFLARAWLSTPSAAHLLKAAPENSPSLSFSPPSSRLLPHPAALTDLKSQLYIFPEL